MSVTQPRIARPTAASECRRVRSGGASASTAGDSVRRCAVLSGASAATRR
jgi:hypothetical protein